VAALRRSLRLDPVSAWNSAIAGFFLCEIDERETGRRQLRKAIELEPNFFLPWSLSSVIDCYEGKFQDALAAAEEGVRLSAGLPMARAYAGYALAMAGRRVEAHAALDQLEDLSRERYVPAVARAWCHVGLGDCARALEWWRSGTSNGTAICPTCGSCTPSGRCFPNPDTRTSCAAWVFRRSRRLRRNQ